MSDADSRTILAPWSYIQGASVTVLDMSHIAESYIRNHRSQYIDGALPVKCFDQIRRHMVCKAQGLW